MKTPLYSYQIAYHTFKAKVFRSVLLKIVMISIICVIICVMICSCGTSIKNEEIDKVVKDDFPITGHLLYGYKHNIMVYGQYMDQAGENNAMILVFVKKESNNSVDACCKSVSVNGIQVESSITIETISPLLSALQINLTSFTTNIDQLRGEDEITLRLDIVDTQSNTTIEVTEPIIFSCN